MANATEMGKRIRALRRAKGETQAMAADAIGLGRSTLSSIETGHDLPGRETMAAIATYFGVTLDYLEAGATTIDSPDSDKLAKDDSELGLLQFWRSLSDVQRDAVAALLGYQGRKRDNIR